MSSVTSFVFLRLQEEIFLKVSNVLCLGVWLCFAEVVVLKKKIICEYLGYLEKSCVTHQQAISHNATTTSRLLAHFLVKMQELRYVVLHKATGTMTSRHKS